MSDLATLAAAAGISSKALAKITANLGPNGLGTASEAELRAHGVAPVLAKRLSAAIALGRTCVIRAGEPKAVIGMPALAAAELAPLIEGLQQELFFTIALDVRNRLLGVFEVARGTVASVESRSRAGMEPGATRSIGPRNRTRVNPGTVRSASARWPRAPTTSAPRSPSASTTAPSAPCCWLNIKHTRERHDAALAAIPVTPTR